MPAVSGNPSASPATTQCAVPPATQTAAATPGRDRAATQVPIAQRGTTPFQFAQDAN
jgi:hypothetical protein